MVLSQSGRSMRVKLNGQKGCKWTLGRVKHKNGQSKRQNIEVKKGRKLKLLKRENERSKRLEVNEPKDSK